MRGCIHTTMDFSRVDLVKSNPKALAVLLDIDFHARRQAFEIIKDLDLPEEEGNYILLALDKGKFIKPNPHRKIKNTNYALAEKGCFLINELKMENPELFKELDSAKAPKLSEFIEPKSISSS